MKNKSVLYSIISISALGLVAKAMGLFREGVAAAYFGTSTQMDVFSLLSGYATMLMTVIAGSLAISFSPYYIGDIEQRGEAMAAKRFSYILNQYVFFSFTFFILIWFVSPWLSDIVCENTNGVDNETVLLYMRLLVATVITGGMTRLFVTALTGLRKYGWMQITQIIYSVLAIILTVFFGKYYGVGVLVVAFVLNSFVQVAVLWIVFYSDGRKYTFSLGIKDCASLESWKAIIPVFFGTEIYMLGLTIDRTIGLTLNMEGAAAALSYAGILYGLINMIVTYPIGTVFSTEMYRNFYKTENREVLFQDLARIVNHQAVIVLPLGVLLFATTNDFITFVLKRGAFDSHSTLMTAGAFCMYALSAPIYAFRTLFTNVHIAIHDRKTPMWSGVIYLVLNICLSWSLSQMIGITGVTLGALCAMIASFGYQYILIQKKHECHHKLFSITFVKILSASIIAGVPTLIFSRMQIILSPYIRFVICVIIFCILYAVILQLTHCGEFELLKQRLLKRFK